MENIDDFLNYLKSNRLDEKTISAYKLDIFQFLEFFKKNRYP